MLTRRIPVPAAAVAAAMITAIGCGFSGPDLVICRIGGTNNTSGFVNHGGASGSRAFSADSVICNFGNVACGWDADPPDPDNNHPVISQTMFRLRNGRFSQIGQSWAKHGGHATQSDECGMICQGGGNNVLGVGCCDAYNAPINGMQNVGPKSEVNPRTGHFPFPFCSPDDGGIACPSPEPTIGRRLQVKDGDIDATAGVQYFLQMHVIVPDDILLGNPPNDLNNASYRRLTMNAGHNIAAWASATIDGQPAIRAWRLNGGGPGVVDPDVIEYIVDVPGDGRFYFAGKATNLGAGQWHYEYAVQNFNSDRAGRWFRVALPNATNISSATFSDVDYHSGEPISNTDWTTSTTPTSITWSTQTYAVNPNANALRWDTLYNFGFDCNKPPTSGAVTLGLFKPGGGGAPASIQALLPAPASDLTTCVPDISGNGWVSVDDLLAVITTWGACAQPGNCPGDIMPSGGNGLVNIDDLLAVITAWGPCP